MMTDDYSEVKILSIAAITVVTLILTPSLFLVAIVVVPLMYPKDTTLYYVCLAVAAIISFFIIVRAARYMDNEVNSMVTDKSKVDAVNTQLEKESNDA